MQLPMNHSNTDDTKKWDRICYPWILTGRKWCKLSKSPFNFVMWKWKQKDRKDLFIFLFTSGCPKKQIKDRSQPTVGSIVLSVQSDYNPLNFLSHSLTKFLKRYLFPNILKMHPFCTYSQNMPLKSNIFTKTMSFYPLVNSMTYQMWKSKHLIFHLKLFVMLLLLPWYNHSNSQISQANLPYLLSCV